MDWGAAVDFIANLAAIATGAVAVGAWFVYRGERKNRAERLKNYLKEQKTSGGFERVTALHLMANLGMTEEQVFDAAFRSKHVRLSPGQDGEGFANRIFFEHTTGDEEDDWRQVVGHRKKPTRTASRTT